MAHTQLQHQSDIICCPPQWDQQRREGLPQRRLTHVISRSPNGSAQARRKLAVAGSLAGFALLLCLRECAQLLHDATGNYLYETQQANAAILPQRKQHSTGKLMRSVSAVRAPSLHNRQQ